MEKGRGQHQPVRGIGAAHPAAANESQAVFSTDQCHQSLQEERKRYSIHTEREDDSPSAFLSFRFESELFPDRASTRFRLALSRPPSLSAPRFVPPEGPMNGLSSALTRFLAAGRDFEPDSRGCIVRWQLFV